MVQLSLVPPWSLSLYSSSGRSQGHVLNPANQTHRLLRARFVRIGRLGSSISEGGGSRLESSKALVYLMFATDHPGGRAPMLPSRETRRCPPLSGDAPTTRVVAIKRQLSGRSLCDVAKRLSHNTLDTPRTELSYSDGKPSQVGNEKKIHFFFGLGSAEVLRFAERGISVRKEVVFVPITPTAQGSGKAGGRGERGLP